ncbi:MAG: chloride channel protein [Bacteroidetes bacterium]|nr:MAG: chloride channel protein [Bacteroidota bacterium]
MKGQSLIEKFLNWRLKHITDRQFMLILSVIIGLAAGLSAVAIKNSVHFIQHLLTSGFAVQYQNYLYFVYPTIGILASILIARYIIKQHVGHGIPSVLHAKSKSNGLIKPHNMYSSIVTSALTVGFGGSVGLEGPTVATGAAIGSNLGRVLRLNYKQITSLLGFACAGAMAAIFKAPIAAIVFALEVIMLDLTMSAMVPLLTASVTAALTSYFMFGMKVLYTFELEDEFLLGDVPYYILFGILAGLISVYFTRVYMFVGGIFENINTWYKKLIFGGLILGVLIFLFPSLYGEGYEAINSALRGDFSYLYDNSIFYDYQDNFLVTLALIAGIVLLKVVATSVTFGSGGVGGIFAPSLFMGVNAGLLYAKAVNHFGMGNISENNFALVGMSGLIAGVIHAPLTAIFLIAEITGGYGLFMPLMIVATISYGTVKIFEANSVYTIQLAKRGELITHHKDKALLSLMKIGSLIEKDFLTVHTDATLGELVKVIAESHRNIFPVVDEENNFHGIVIMDRVRHIMFQPELYDTTMVRNIMFTPSNTVNYNDPMEQVAQKFQHSGKYNLVVLKEGKYVGFVSRANVFSKYRELLKDFSEH